MPNELWNDPGFAATCVAGALRDRPLGFVDIGARGGVHPTVEPLAGGTAVLCFEPDEAACACLRAEYANGNSPWHSLSVEAAALGESAAHRTLYQCVANTNDSLLPTDPTLVRRYAMAKFEPTTTRPVDTVSLDSVLFGPRAAGPQYGEFLKIDTQGTELEILRGAERTLRERTVAVVVETWFCPIYSGGPLFSDVEQFLRKQGFSFYGFPSLFQRSQKRLDKRVEAGAERLLYADAVFLKDPFDPNRPPPSTRSRQVLFACALLLGYHDFAIELSAGAAEKQPGDASQLEAVVRRHASIDPANARIAAIELADRVEREPDLANIAVGRFVDARRFGCDYSDV